jgi:hypothetical protein
MATYEYNGDSVLEFPTLGIVAKKGDQFEGPDGITASGVSVVTGKSGKAMPVAPKEETPVETDTKEVN